MSMSLKGDRVEVEINNDAVRQGRAEAGIAIRETVPNLRSSRVVKPD